MDDWLLPAEAIEARCEDKGSESGVEVCES